MNVCEKALIKIKKFASLTLTVMANIVDSPTTQKRNDFLNSFKRINGNI